jgi:hypothetical protein
MTDVSPYPDRIPAYPGYGSVGAYPRIPPFKGDTDTGYGQGGRNTDTAEGYADTAKINSEPVRIELRLNEPGAGRPSRPLPDSPRLGRSSSQTWTPTKAPMRPIRAAQLHTVRGRGKR